MKIKKNNLIFDLVWASLNYSKRVFMNVLTYMNVLPFGKLQMEILKCVIAQLSLACIAGSVGELCGNLRFLSYYFKQVCRK